MYESFFGFDHRPFAATPDQRMFVPLDSVVESLESLDRCICNGHGVAILTAPAGMGKTEVCLELVEQLSEAFATVFLANSNMATCRALLQAILYELGHPYAKLPEQELRLRLAETAKQLLTEKQGVVLIIDEAHLLGNRLLNELRSITNLAENGRSLFRVVLSGQLALEEKLTLPELQGLNERIDCHVSLEPLTRLQSAEYIQTRLQLVGANVSEVYTTEALEMIAHVSDGCPRCLNQLADHSLLLAYVSEERPVSVETVRESLDDLKQLPLHWNEPLPAATPLEQLTEQVAESSFSDADETAEHAFDDEVTPTDAVEFDAVEFGSVEFGSVEVGGVEVGENTEVDQPAVAEELDEGMTVFEVGSPQSETHATETFTPEPAAVDELSLTTTQTADFADIVSQPISFNGLMSAREVDRSVDFVEEQVVDRYARLDAGMSAGKLDTTRSDHLAAPAVEAAAEEIEQTLDSLDSSPRLAEPVGSGTEPVRPERILEELLPLLSEALSPMATSEVADPEVATSEVAKPLADIVGVPRPAAVEPSSTHPDIDEELEARIAATVFDVCVETQAAIESRIDDQPAEVQQFPELRSYEELRQEIAFDGPERNVVTSADAPIESLSIGSLPIEPAPVQPLSVASLPIEHLAPDLRAFDIVQPEVPFDSQETASPEAQQGTRYDRLFSQLRRGRRSRQA